MLGSPSWFSSLPCGALPFLCPAFIPCVYLTRPQATLECGREGLFLAPFTGCSCPYSCLLFLLALCGLFSGVFWGPSSVRTMWAAPPPHFPLCVCALSHGFLLCFYPPLRFQAQHCCTGPLLLRLNSVHITGFLALTGRSAWRSPAKPGARPSLASPSLCCPPSPKPRRTPLTCPPYCFSPALCAPRCSSLSQGCIWRAFTRLSACARSSVL